MTHLSLFSGIGGLDLAAEMAGFKTVGQCEWADYPTKVLERHWPNVPRWRDIRTLTKESFFEKTGLRTVDIISGGFPCQPFSVAGKRGGENDDRYLWPEMLRVIEELRPTFVLGENVVGIISLALDTVLSDLETLGYSAQAFVVPACGVDAPHRRERVAIVAYAESKFPAWRLHRGEENPATDGRQGFDNRTGTEDVCVRLWWENQSGVAGMADGVRAAIHEADPDRRCVGCEHGSKQPLVFTDCSSREREREPEREVPTQSLRTLGTHTAWENWPDEPELDRVVDGIPNRMDRIKCLGNAVVPQQFYPFFYYIRKLMESEE